MDDSNQPTSEDLNVIGEMGPTALRIGVHFMGGHPSVSTSDEHMPSPMLRLTYSNLQATGALVGPTHRPLTTQPYQANELRMEEGFGRSTWPQADPNGSGMMDADWTAIDGSQVRRVRVMDFRMDASLAMAQLWDLTETFAGYCTTMEEITNETIMAIH